MGQSPFDLLTRKEEMVARLMCSGASVEAITGELNINNKTVATHRGKVMKKTGALHNMDLLRLAVYWGFVEPLPVRPPDTIDDYLPAPAVDWSDDEVPVQEG